MQKGSKGERHGAGKYIPPAMRSRQPPQKEDITKCPIEISERMDNLVLLFDSVKAKELPLCIVKETPLDVIADLPSESPSNLKLYKHPNSRLKLQPLTTELSSPSHTPKGSQANSSFPSPLNRLTSKLSVDGEVTPSNRNSVPWTSPKHESEKILSSLASSRSRAYMYQYSTATLNRLNNDDEVIDTKPSPSSAHNRMSMGDDWDSMFDEDIKPCTIVLNGISSDMSETQKSSILKPFHDRGALSRWMSLSEAIIVFSTASLARIAFESNKSVSIQCHPLDTMSDLLKVESYASAAKELHKHIKRPDRDPATAQRMISAALGVRLPSRSTPHAQMASVVSSVSDGMGSWDD